MGRLIYSLVRLALILTVRIPIRIIQEIMNASASKKALERGREKARILKVYDGDTILVRASGGREEAVRLIGIDALESSYNDRLKIQQRQTGLTEEALLKMGKRGTEALRIILEESGAYPNVELEFDAESRDKYGRLLAYVKSPDNVININAAMVRTGYALNFPSTKNRRYTTQIARYEKRAKSEETGLWGEGWDKKSLQVMRAEISLCLREMVGMGAKETTSTGVEGVFRSDSAPEPEVSSATVTTVSRDHTQRTRSRRVPELENGAISPDLSAESIPDDFVEPGM